MSSAPCLHRDSQGNQCFNSVKRGTGYCQAHQKPKWDGYREKYSKLFIQNKPTVTRRAQGRCENQPEGYSRCSRVGTQVDHIIPRAEGGSDDLHNLQLLCDDCHKQKTQEDAKRGWDSINKPARRGQNNMPESSGSSWM